MGLPRKIKSDAAFTKMWLNPGFTTKEVAAHFRVSIHVVYDTQWRLNLATARQVKRKRQGGNVPNLSDMQAMWEQGAKVQAIADRFERNPSYIYNLACRFNRSRRAGKGNPSV